jgi:hypothetical protein
LFRYRVFDSISEMPRFLALLTFLAFAYPACAQQPTFHDALLDHFVGKWTLRGTIAGQPATHDVTADWVLEHQYLRFHEVSREKNQDGTPFYEAIVFIGWNAGTSQYACAWHDTYGGISPISLGYAERKTNTLSFLFKDKKNIFHTVFLYQPQRDSWQWKMDSEKNGELTPFARVTLTRVP